MTPSKAEFVWKEITGLAFIRPLNLKGVVDRRRCASPPGTRWARPESPRTTSRTSLDQSTKRVFLVSELAWEAVVHHVWG